MDLKHEIPLRGWKEIKPLLGVDDRRTARKILASKNLLKYEGATPVLLASEYLQTLRPNIDLMVKMSVDALRFMYKLKSKK